MVFYWNTIQILTNPSSGWELTSLIFALHMWKKPQKDEYPNWGAADEMHRGLVQWIRKRTWVTSVLQWFWSLGSEVICRTRPRVFLTEAQQPKTEVSAAFSAHYPSSPSSAEAIELLFEISRASGNIRTENSVTSYTHWATYQAITTWRNVRHFPRI